MRASPSSPIPQGDEGLVVATRSEDLATAPISYFDEGLDQMKDAELVEFATAFREGILNGHPSSWMCAAICWPLVTLLNLHGVECETVESDLGDLSHVWLRLADGRALDPTADQFNALFPSYKLPPVYLGKPLDIHADGAGAKYLPPADRKKEIA